MRVARTCGLALLREILATSGFLPNLKPKRERDRIESKKRNA
jgi:hypothetical protein